jgi:Zn-dependent protease
VPPQSDILVSTVTFSHKSFHVQATWGALLLVLLLLLFSISQLGLRSGTAGGLLLMVCLLLHEGAHVAVALITRTPVLGAGVSLKGPYIRRKAASSAIAEICIAASGLLVNLVLALALWRSSGMLRWLAEMNAFLGLTNLLPLSGSDGKRILDTIRPPRRAAKVVSAEPAATPPSIA